jgi:hypothetical protein
MERSLGPSDHAISAALRERARLVAAVIRTRQRDVRLSRPRITQRQDILPPGNPLAAGRSRSIIFNSTRRNTNCSNVAASLAPCPASLEYSRTMVGKRNCFR